MAGKPKRFLVVSKGVAVPSLMTLAEINGNVSTVGLDFLKDRQFFSILSSGDLIEMEVQFTVRLAEPVTEDGGR